MAPTRRNPGRTIPTMRWAGLLPVVAALLASQLLSPAAAAATRPDMPTMGTATRGDQQATVTWIAPTDGGSPITGYTIRAYVGTTVAKIFNNVQCSTVHCSATVSGLINGTAYTLTVAAVNAVGEGPESVHSNPVTPAGKPFAPTNVQASGGNGAATVSWTAPNANGSAIISYTVSCNPDCPGATGLTVTGSPPDTTTTVGNLANGTTYTFTVTATNDVDQGSPSAASNPVTMGAPNAPTGVKATGGNKQATLTWTAPDDNGSGITKYTISCNPACAGATGLTVTGTPPDTKATVGKLANGTTYTFTVTATNTWGTGPASSPSNAVLVGAPGRPAKPQATPGDRQATVTWTAPDGNGSAITSYTIRVYTGATLARTVTGATCGQSGCSTIITGLTNGTAYAFTVAAVNGIGEGPESDKSDPVTPFGVPAAPTIGTATGGDGQATVTWTAPDSNGSAIISYTIRAYSGGAVAVTVTDVTCSTTSCSSIVTGLTNCTSYTFRVAAVNAAGEGSQSAASNAVTPGSGKPCAPTIGTATAGNKQATITWTAPGSDGGSAITSYTVRAYVDTTVAKTVFISCDTTSCSTTMKGLDNGTTYTFTIAANNANGEGPESAHSNAVTPKDLPPSAPTIGTATAGSRSATVTWSAPPDNGDPVTSYTVRAFVGTTEASKLQGVQCATFNCSVTMTGLTNGTTYTFTVAAVNSQGEGAQSAASNAVTPVGVPDPPTNVQATAGNASASVTWSAPANNGGSAITQYNVFLTSGSISLEQHIYMPGSLQATFTGLANGTTYDVAVAAVNAAGQGAAAHSSVTPQGSALTLPGGATSVSATAGIGSATVTWSAASSTSALTKYTVTAYKESTSNVAATLDVSGSVTSATVNGLTNGGTYTFTVTAFNAAGKGPESSRSNSITLPDVPGAPTNLQASAGTGQTTVSWTAPASNGGSTITSYILTVHDNSTGETFSVTVGGDRTSVTLTTLSPGRSYYFTIVAVNAVGQSAASSATSAILIPTLPGPPLNLQVTVKNGSAQISWQPPASDGGSAVTGYQVTVWDGTHPATVLTPRSTSVTVDGLVNGVTYTVTVVAINAVGQGGSASTAVTPSAGPAAPNAAPSLNLPADQTAKYGQALSLDVSGSDPEASDHLTLSVAGLPGGLSFADRGDGHGTVSGTVLAPAGIYSAIFTVDDGHNPPVSHDLTITVVAAGAVVTPADTNPSSVFVKKVSASAKSITLKANIAASDTESGGDITNAVPVTCTLRSLNSGAMYTRRAKIQDGGNKTLAASCTFRSIPVDVYRARFEVGGQYYSGSATDFLTVYGPSRASVRASGTITRQGVSASFSISAKFVKGNHIQASLTYTEHRSAGDVTVKSTLAGGLVFKAHKAYFEGKATLDGGGQYTVVATVLNNSYRKGKDRFGIRLVADHQFVPDFSFSPADVASGTVVLPHG